MQVVGEVRNPGEYRFVKGADFYHYLVKAGGPTTGSDLSGIEILRNSTEGKRLTRFGFGHPDDIPAIESGDLIVLLADKPTTIERTVPVIAGIVGVFNTVLLLLLVF